MVRVGEDGSLRLAPMPLIPPPRCGGARAAWVPLAGLLTVVLAI